MYRHIKVYISYYHNLVVAQNDTTESQKAKLTHSHSLKGDGCLTYPSKGNRHRQRRHQPQRPSSTVSEHAHSRVHAAHPWPTHPARRPSKALGNKRQRTALQLTVRRFLSQNRVVRCLSRTKSCAASEESSGNCSTKCRGSSSRRH